MLLPNEGDGSFAVKVLDFGIAKILQPETNDDGAPVSSNVGLTRVGTLVGTPEYMSPEQCMGSPVDARSDVYSCGVMLYQLVTGRPPFTGNQPGEILFQHTDIAPMPPRQRCPSIYSGLEAGVPKSLAKDADQRYQTARELRTALEGIRPELSSERSASAKPPVLHADAAEDEVITVALNLPETSPQTLRLPEAAHASDEPGPMTQRSVALAAASVGAAPHERDEAFGDDGDEGSRLWQPLALPSGNVESTTLPANSAATRAARVAARRATIMSMRRSSMRPPPLRAFLLRYGVLLIALAALGTAGFAASLFLGRQYRPPKALLAGWRRHAARVAKREFPQAGSQASPGPQAGSQASPGPQAGSQASPGPQAGSQASPGPAPAARLP